MPPKRVYLDYPAGPNPAQVRAHNLAPHADEILYGGALGGGKTDFLLAFVLRLLFDWPGANALILRRTFPELELLGGIVQRLLDRIPQPDVGVYHRDRHVWAFRNGPDGGETGGSQMQLGHLNAGDADLPKYLGGEYFVIGIDQAEEFTLYQVMRLASRLRVGGELGHRMRAAGASPKLALTANPGGPGHSWLKERYVDQFPTGNQIFRPPPTPDDKTPRTRVFIPARVYDNLEHIGEDYLRTLNQLDEDDRRALRDGDWNVYKGQRFASFRADVHTVEPEEAPIPLGSGVARGTGTDYGLDAPFVTLWGALTHQVHGVYLEEPALIVYREIDGAGLTPEQQAQAILAAEHPQEWGSGGRVAVIDPATWARAPDKPAPRSKGSTVSLAEFSAPEGSIADTYRSAGVFVRKADNRRLEGVALVADLLRLRADGLPRLFVYTTCTDLIRTLPLLQRDPKRPEDVLKCDFDHWYDALRYLAMRLRGSTPQVDTSVGLPPARRVTPPTAEVARALRGSTLSGLRRRGF